MSSMLSKDARPSSLAVIAVDGARPQGVGGGPAQSALGRRLERACDMCRKKKVKCDGIRESANQCTNCIINGWDCTYVEISLRRAPPKSYVEGLEKRVEQLTRILTKIVPDEVQAIEDEYSLCALASTTLRLQTEPSTPLNFLGSFSSRSNGRQGNDLMPALLRHIANFPRGHTDSLEMFGEQEEEEEEEDTVVENTALSGILENMSLRETHLRSSRHSAGVQYIETAYKLKQEALHTRGISVSVLNRQHTDDDFLTFSNDLWTSPETSQPFHSKLVFPPHDLMFALVDLYFKHMNAFYPFLHQPTLQRSIVDGLHIKNDLFAATLLLVCAIGARFSDDDRVLLDRSDPMWKSVRDMTDDQFSYSRGWQWAIQVPVVHRPPTESPSLYELQFYVLWAQFLQGASAAQSCWPAIGFGIRVAQEAGVSGKKNLSLTLEDELWKRAFWVLVCLDRQFSSTLGRPVVMHDEDFDVELPIECDDEYLDHPDPKQRFKQPPDRPSIVTYFSCYLRLNQILAFLLRTMYAINRHKILFGYVGQGERKMVTELDSALNQWEESLPPHLTWDPQRSNDLFFNQSATLHCAYQYVRILVHRPFIPSPRTMHQMSYPSLTICTSAARACANALDVQRQRVRFAPMSLQAVAFAAGVMLLMRIWSGKKAGLTTDVEEKLRDVKKCLDSLKAAEVRHYAAGRQWDLLNTLADMDDLRVKREPSDSPPHHSGPQGHSPPPQQGGQPIEIGEGYVTVPGNGNASAHETRQQQQPLDVSVRLVYGDKGSPNSDLNDPSDSTMSTMQFQSSTNFWYDPAQPFGRQSASPPGGAGPVGGGGAGVAGSAGGEDSSMEYVEYVKPRGGMVGGHHQQQQHEQQTYAQPQVMGGTEIPSANANGANPYSSQPIVKGRNSYPTPLFNNGSNEDGYATPPNDSQTAIAASGATSYIRPYYAATATAAPPAQEPVGSYVTGNGRQGYAERPPQRYNQYPSPPVSTSNNNGYFHATNGHNGYPVPSANTAQNGTTLSQAGQASYGPHPPLPGPKGYPSQENRYTYPAAAHNTYRPRPSPVANGNNMTYFPPPPSQPQGDHPAYGSAFPTNASALPRAGSTPYVSSPYPAVPARQAVNTAPPPAQAQNQGMQPAAEQVPAGRASTQRGGPSYGNAPQQPTDGTQPHQQQTQHQQTPRYVQNLQQQQQRPQPIQNMYAMWSAVPAGFRIDEWGQYLSDMNGGGTGKDPWEPHQPPVQNYTWQYQNE